MAPWTYVVTYDVADDRRRERLASLLSGYGPRVQLSVFECLVRSRSEACELRARIHDIIDRQEDQVRLYHLAEKAGRRTWVLGTREIEERRDFWLIR